MPHRTMASGSLDLIVHDAGRMPYDEALTLQRKLQAQVIAARDQPARRMHLIMVEHDPPVITVTKRANAPQHLLATPQQLADAGVEVARSDRGGDITYHGPGQLVVYPILDLNKLHLRMRSYVHLLEQIVIDTLAQFGITAQRDACATGVWATSGSSGAQLSKVCAIGVRLDRWVTMHGFALNVETNLDHFDLIIPCGLACRTVTSMQQLLGDNCPSMAAVKRTVVESFRSELGACQ